MNLKPMISILKSIYSEMGRKTEEDGARILILNRPSQR